MKPRNIRQCSGCSGTNFVRVDADLECSNCGIRLTGSYETHVEDEFVDEEAGGFQALNRNFAQTSRIKHSYITYEECIQLILQTQLVVLIEHFGMPSALYDLAGSLWFHFLTNVHLIPYFYAFGIINPTHLPPRLANSVEVNNSAIQSSMSTQESEKAFEQPPEILDSAKYRDSMYKDVDLWASDTDEDSVLDLSSSNESSPYISPNENEIDEEIEDASNQTHINVDSREETALDISDDEIKLPPSKRIPPKQTENKVHQFSTQLPLIKEEAILEPFGQHTPSNSKKRKSRSVLQSSSGSAQTDKECSTNMGISEDDEGKNGSIQKPLASITPLVTPNPKRKPETNNVVIGKRKKRTQGKKRGAQLSLLRRSSYTLQITLIIIFVSCLYLRLPVTPWDIISWCKNGRLPYFRVSAILPQDAVDLNKFRHPQLLGTRKLISRSKKFLLHMNLSRSIPSINTIPTLTRLCRLLGVPTTVENAARILIDINPRWEQINIFMGLVNPYLLLAAHVIIVLKLIYKFNDVATKTTLESMKKEGFASVTDWIVWQEQYISTFHSSITWNLSSLHNLSPTDLEEFIRYCHTTALFTSDSHRARTQYKDLMTSFNISKPANDSLDHLLTFNPSRPTASSLKKELTEGALLSQPGTDYVIYESNGLGDFHKSYQFLLETMALILDVEWQDLHKAVQVVETTLGLNKTINSVIISPKNYFNPNE